MIVVSATKLRNNLSDFLVKVSEGETITVQRNGEIAAVVMPPPKKDWRGKMRSRVKFIVPPDEAFAPIEDIIHS